MQAASTAAGGYHPIVSDDLRPAYIAFIRRELRLPPGSDALLELRVRLRPEDADAKPPYRAPSIVRLRRGLKRLDAGKAPVDSLEQFADDLRFLQLFAADEPPPPQGAMRRLLSDVMNAPPIRKTPQSGPANDEKVVPFRRRPSADSGDA